MELQKAWFVGIDCGVYLFRRTQVHLTTSLQVEDCDTEEDADALASRLNEVVDEYNATREKEKSNGFN